MAPETLTSARVEYLLAGSPLLRRGYALAASAALLVAAAFASFVTLRMFARVDGAVLQVFLTALAYSLAASTVPVAVLWYLDRRERETRGLFAVAFLWGGLIATGLALPLNSWILGAVEAWLRGRPDVAAYLGPDAALMIGAPIAGPLVEEVTKGLGVLALFVLLRAEFDNVRDGFIYGALVGAGFNCMEAPLYVAQGFAEFGTAPWGLQLGGRYALFGLAGHAMWTGVFGALLGLGRQTRRRWLAALAPLLGLALAVGAHAFNNALGLLVTVALRQAGQPLPEPGPPPDVPFLESFLTRSVFTLILFFPMVLITAALVWRSGAWERRVIREQLAPEVGGAVTPEEYERIARDGIFRTRRIAGAGRRASAALVNAQNELAFRRWRVAADGGDPDQDPLVHGWRRRIAGLREG